jgi:hypothetical protein
MDAGPSTHPTPESVQAYGQGMLDAAAAEVVSKHLEDRHDCRRERHAQHAVGRRERQARRERDVQDMHSTRWVDVQDRHSTKTRYRDKSYCGSCAADRSCVPHERSGLVCADADRLWNLPFRGRWIDGGTMVRRAGRHEIRPHDNWDAQTTGQDRTVSPHGSSGYSATLGACLRMRPCPAMLAPTKARQLAASENGRSIQ